MLAIDRRAGTAVDGETRKNSLVASFARNLGGESEMITTLPSRLHGNQCLFDMPRKYQKHYSQNTSLTKRGRGGDYPAGVSICPKENSSVTFSRDCSSTSGTLIPILADSRLALALSPFATRTLNFNELFNLIFPKRFLSLHTGSNLASVKTLRNSTTAFLYTTGKSGAPGLGGVTRSIHHRSSTISEPRSQRCEGLSTVWRAPVCEETSVRVCWGVKSFVDRVTSRIKGG